MVSNPAEACAVVRGMRNPMPNWTARSKLEAQSKSGPKTSWLFDVTKLLAVSVGSGPTISSGGSWLPVISCTFVDPLNSITTNLSGMTLLRGARLQARVFVWLITGKTSWPALVIPVRVSDQLVGFVCCATHAERGAPNWATRMLHAVFS